MGVRDSPVLAFRRYVATCVRYAFRAEMIITLTPSTLESPHYGPGYDGYTIYKIHTLYAVSV